MVGPVYGSVEPVVFDAVGDESDDDDDDDDDDDSGGSSGEHENVIFLINSGRGRIRQEWFK